MTSILVVTALLPFGMFVALVRSGRWPFALALTAGLAFLGSLKPPVNAMLAKQ